MPVRAPPHIPSLLHSNARSCGLTGTLPPSLGSLAQLEELCVGVALAGPHTLHHMCCPASHVFALPSLMPHRLPHATPPPSSQHAVQQQLDRHHPARAGPVHAAQAPVSSEPRVAAGVGAVCVCAGRVRWYPVCPPPPRPRTLTHGHAHTPTTHLHRRLATNQLDGVIPTSLAALTKLTSLTANDNSLSGDMPPVFGGMASLANLQVYSNQLTGPLPDMSATALATLEARDNLLSGTLPASLSALAATLVTLYVVGPPEGGRAPIAA